MFIRFVVVEDIYKDIKNVCFNFLWFFFNFDGNYYIKLRLYVYDVLEE